MPWSLLLSPTVLLAIALAAASGFGWLQTHRLGSAKAEIVAVQATFDAFKAQVAAEGRAAQEKADKAVAAQKQQVAQLEVQHEKDLVDYGNSIRASEQRMRDAVSAGGGVVPNSPGSSGQPQATVCFDRATLAGGINAGFQRFAGRYSGLLREGGEAAISLRACLLGWKAVAEAVK